MEAHQERHVPRLVLTKEGTEGLAELNRILEQNSSDTWAYAKRGAIYYQLQRYDKALADFRRAIELSPTYAWAYAQRGQTYYLLNCYAEALADFNQAIALTPDSAWALAQRGVVHYRRLDGQLDYDQALADLTQAIKLKPDYVWALIQRANLYVMTQRYKEGLADADQVYALNKNIVPNWFGERGLLLNYLGRYTDTIECCQQAVREDPSDYFALYSLTVARALSEGLAQAQPDILRTRSVLQLVMETKKCGLVIYRLGGLAALEGKTTQGLDYLQQAIPLHSEPIIMARNDPAWLNLRSDRRFQALIAESNRA